jgi:hypothetical protein
MRLPAGRSILINPMYGDALGGEFFPPTDPGKAHTLGRLAVGTVLKGSRPDTSEMSDTANYTYCPSWAPGVTATATCLEKRRIKYSEIIRLRLAQPHNSYSLLLRSIVDGGQGPDRIEIIFGSESQELPLALGPDISTARGTVSKFAQEFFDSLIA